MNRTTRTVGHSMGSGGGSARSLPGADKSKGALGLSVREVEVLVADALCEATSARKTPVGTPASLVSLADTLRAGFRVTAGFPTA